MATEGVVLGGRGGLVRGGVAELGDMRQVVEIHEGRGHAVVVGRAGREATGSLAEVVTSSPVWGEEREMVPDGR